MIDCVQTFDVHLSAEAIWPQCTAATHPFLAFGSALMRGLCILLLRPSVIYEQFLPCTSTAHTQAWNPFEDPPSRIGLYATMC